MASGRPWWAWGTCEYPSLRSWSEAKPLIREAVSIEPTMLLPPRIALLLRSYGSVERVIERTAVARQTSTQ